MRENIAVKVVFYISTVIYLFLLMVACSPKVPFQATKLDPAVNLFKTTHRYSQEHHHFSADWVTFPVRNSYIKHYSQNEELFINSTTQPKLLKGLTIFNTSSLNENNTNDIVILTTSIY